MGDSYTPPPAFGFSVSLLAPRGGTVEADAAFQNVSGLDQQLAVEAPEGGASSYVHQLPGVTTHSNLVLRQGYVRQPSALADWAGQTVGSTLGAPVQTLTLVVTLLGSDGAALVRWTLANAWPVKWEVGALDSGTDNVLTEALEIAYTTVTRTIV